MKEYFMREALKEAKLAYDKGEVPIGAVVVKGNEIIGRGHNEKIINNDPTSHGEINAIKEASKYINHWWLENCDIYITLEPCSMCAGAILNARMNRVFIGARDLRMGAFGSAIDLSNVDTFNHKVTVEFGILEEECSEILSEFFKNLRKNKK